MTSLEEVIRIREKIWKDASALVATKGHDYNNKQQLAGDTLFNLRVPYVLGITDSLLDHVLGLMCNKLMRLGSLKGADPAVKGESFRDTILDLVNYATYLEIFYEEEANKVK